MFARYCDWLERIWFPIQYFAQNTSTELFLFFFVSRTHDCKWKGYFFGNTFKGINIHSSFFINQKKEPFLELPGVERLKLSWNFTEGKMALRVTFFIIWKMDFSKKCENNLKCGKIWRMVKTDVKIVWFENLNAFSVEIFTEERMPFRKNSAETCEYQWNKSWRIFSGILQWKSYETIVTGFICIYQIFWAV